jgi:hypothetical protein
MTEICSNQSRLTVKTVGLLYSLYARPPRYSCLAHPEVVRVPVLESLPVVGDYAFLFYISTTQ